MRILHVVPSYIPAYRYGGPIVSVHALCKALAAAGHEISVFTTNVDGPGVSVVPTDTPVDLDGVRIRYFPATTPRRLYYSPKMADALREVGSNADIVHTHSVFLWPTWAAARAAQKARVPFVVSPRGMLVKGLIEKKSRLLKAAAIRFAERPTFEAAAAVHVTSASEGRDLSALGFEPRRLLVVPNGVEVPQEAEEEAPCRHALGWREGEKVILYLGRVDWKKGLDRLIRSLVEIPGARLVIAGNDEENYTASLVKIAEKAGVADRVTFTGAVYGTPKWNMLRSADCFALASYSENFGNSVLEAMAAGCAVVVTPEVGMADVVQRSGAGAVVSGEPKPFGQAIAALLADGPKRAAMASAGRRVARAEFDWTSIAARMAQAYTAILAENSNRGAGNAR